MYMWGNKYTVYRVYNLAIQTIIACFYIITTKQIIKLYICIIETIQYIYSIQLLVHTEI